MSKETGNGLPFYNLPPLEEQEKRRRYRQQINHFKEGIGKEIESTYGEISKDKDYQGTINISFEGFSQIYYWRLWKVGELPGPKHQRIPIWWCATLQPQKNSENPTPLNPKIKEHVKENNEFILIAIKENLTETLQKTSTVKITLAEEK